MIPIGRFGNMIIINAIIRVFLQIANSRWNRIIYPSPVNSRFDWQPGTPFAWSNWSWFPLYFWCTSWTVFRTICFGLPFAGQIVCLYSNSLISRSKSISISISRLQGPGVQGSRGPAFLSSWACFASCAHNRRRIWRCVCVRVSLRL